ARDPVAASLGIQDRKRTVTDPADRAVRPHDAVFLVIRALSLADRALLDAFAVGRMDGIQPRPWRGVQRRAAAAPNFVVGRADIKRLPHVRIDEPEHFADVLSDLAELLFAAAHRLLGALAL